MNRSTFLTPVRSRAGSGITELVCVCVCVCVSPAQTAGDSNE